MISDGDKDGDKELTSDEFAALADAWFKKLDSGGTGKLSQEQLTSKLRDLFPPGAAPEAALESGSGARPEGAAAAPLNPEVLGPILFKAIDLDKDGSVTETEWKETFRKWFTDWDTSRSGKLNQENLRKGLEAALPRSALASRAGATASRGPTPLTSETPRVERIRPEKKAVADPATDRPESPKPANPPSLASSRSGVAYEPFKIIADRNIFNPNRRARANNSAEEARPKQTETLTLVGTLVYEKGPYAFFDGTSSDANKVVETGNTIAGFKAVEITGNGVKLEKGSNTLQLVVGMQLRREEDGDWEVVASSRPQTISTSTSTSPPPADAGSDDNDIVKRLMKQREEELK
jgi:hypothetical protein